MSKRTNKKKHYTLSAATKPFSPFAGGRMTRPQTLRLMVTGAGWGVRDLGLPWRRPFFCDTISCKGLKQGQEREVRTWQSREADPAGSGWAKSTGSLVYGNPLLPASKFRHTGFGSCLQHTKRPIIRQPEWRTVGVMPDEHIAGRLWIPRNVRPGKAVMHRNRRKSAGIVPDQRMENGGS